MTHETETAGRIWEGRCEDCFGKKPGLCRCPTELLPPGLIAELCPECVDQRRRNAQEGKASYEVGLPPSWGWVAVPQMTVSVTEKVINIDVKRSTRGENAAIVRLRFEGQKKWMAAGAFGYSDLYAQSEVRGFLRLTYFPHAPITYLKAI
jgi:hypothetical protein